MRQLPQLACPVCGRRAQPDDGAAASAHICPSCGAALAPIVSSALDRRDGVDESSADATVNTPDVGIDDATTQRMQPEEEVGAPSVPVSEATTAILTPSSLPSPTSGAAEVDRYQTSVANEEIPTLSLAGPATDPRTQPVVAPSLPETQDLPASTRPTATRTEGWRNPWLVLAIIVVLVALFAGGLVLSRVAGKNTARPHATPAALSTSTPVALPAGYVLVKSATSDYSFAVPSDWMAATVSGAAPNTNYTIYTSPSRDATFEVESFPTGTQQGGAALDTLFLTRSFPSGSVTHLTPPTNEPLAGETWVEETADVTLTENGAPQTLHLVVQTTTHNGNTYIIFYNVAADGSQTANAQTTLLILGTFAFLS